MKKEKEKKKKSVFDEECKLDVCKDYWLHILSDHTCESTQKL